MEKATKKKLRNTSTRVWAIRAGRGGKAHDLFLHKSLIALENAEMGDLKKIGTLRDHFYEKYRSLHPDETRSGSAGVAGKYYRFTNEVGVGDLIVYPALTRMVHIGRVTGRYRFVSDSDFPHQRKVQWLAEIAKSHFQDPVLREFGAARTFFEIKRHASVVQDLASAC